MRGGNNEALQAAWEEHGRPGLYEAPGEQEWRGLLDPRHRRRGEHAQRQRLERGWLPVAVVCSAHDRTGWCMSLADDDCKVK